MTPNPIHSWGDSYFCSVSMETWGWIQLRDNEIFDEDHKASPNIFMSKHVLILIYILIANSGTNDTFPAHLQLQIHMPTCSLSSYLAASAKSGITLFRQIVTLRGKPCQYCTNVYGPFGEHLADCKDSSRESQCQASLLAPSSFCWQNLACENPLADVYPVIFTGGS